MKLIDNLCEKNMEIDNIIKNFIIDYLENYYNSIKNFILDN